jgi:cytochrome P450
VLNLTPSPLAGWKKLCADVKRGQRNLYFGLLSECEQRVKQGKQTGCFVEEVIERREEFGLSRDLAGYLAGVLLEGGSDTTSSYLQSLVLAMVAYPEVQRRAQAEIDAVVGDLRSPTLGDMPNLPYIQAVVKEVRRVSRRVVREQD